MIVLPGPDERTRIGGKPVDMHLDGGSTRLN